MKVYDINSDEEVNGIFGTADHDDDSGNDNENNIPRAKLYSIKNKNKNKPSSPIVKVKFLQSTHYKETNEKEKYEKIDTSYNKIEDKDEEIT